MLKALYYPHTDIESSLILKNALLLWDSVDVIVPRANWKFARGRDKAINEAFELVVRERVPNASEQRIAHTALLKASRDGSLFSLVQQGPRKWRDQNYLIYPEKFLKATWHLLEQGRMARWVEAETDYGVPAGVGFWMMSILADACAGSQIQKITDRVEAYSWIAKYRAQQSGNQYVEGLDVSQVAPSYDRIVTLSLDALDARRVSLKELVNLRKRENKNSGNDYANMRRRFLKAVDNYIARIAKDAKTESDVREIERQYRLEIENDLKELKRELGIASVKALFSKEVAVSAVIIGGAMLAPIAGLTALASNVGGLGIIPLVKTGVDLREARRKALNQHATSWLYLSKKGPLTLY